MAKESDTSWGKLKWIITIFVGLMVTIPLLVALTSETLSKTEYSTISNESLNISNAFIDANNINVSVSFDPNESPLVEDSLTITMGNGTLYTLTTDYTVNYTSEAINFKNTTKVLSAPSTLVYLNYEAEPGDYISDSTIRVLLGFMGLFFTLAILFMVLNYFRNGNFLDFNLN
jgi:hypothetical protein